MSQFTPRQVATIVAALRYYQMALDHSGVPLVVEDIATANGTIVPLNSSQLDILCAKVAL